MAAPGEGILSLSNTGGYRLDDGGWPAWEATHLGQGILEASFADIGDLKRFSEKYEVTGALKGTGHAALSHGQT